MMKAKVMLEEGTLKIVQIAKACGYENQSYFNKLFKNYYGITPKQLREKYEKIWDWYYGKASIRKKLIISYLILVILPILVLGMYSYYVSKKI